MEGKGISCPSCGCRMNKVTHTYHFKWNGIAIIKRRRLCRHCNLPFNTKEIPEENPDCPNKPDTEERL